MTPTKCVYVYVTASHIRCLVAGGLLWMMNYLNKVQVGFAFLHMSGFNLAAVAVELSICSTLPSFGMSIDMFRKAIS